MNSVMHLSRKRQSQVARFFRTLFAFVTLLMPVLSLILTTTVLLRKEWFATVPEAADEAADAAANAAWTEEAAERWIDWSPAAGARWCVDNHQGYCTERNDAFSAVSYLSVTALVAQSIAAAVLVRELAAYGVFGGSHTNTRVVMILSMIILATQMLSVIAFYDVYDGRHCGDDSLRQRGAALGWGFYFRAAEMAISLGFVAHSVYLFSRSRRGPPCGTLLIQLLAIVLTTVSTFSNSWLTLRMVSPGEVSQNYHFSSWSACTDSPLEECDDASATDGAMRAAFGLTISQLVLAFIACFFVALRAVDSEGATLKFAQLASLLTVAIAAGNVGNAFGAERSFACAVAGASGGSADDAGQDGRLLRVKLSALSSVDILVLSLAAQVLFFFLNLVFMLPSRVCGGSGEPAPESGAARQLLFHSLWWNHLKDAKTIAHETRELDTEEEGSSDRAEDDGEASEEKQ